MQYILVVTDINFEHSYTECWCLHSPFYEVFIANILYHINTDFITFKVVKLKCRNAEVSQIINITIIKVRKVQGIIITPFRENK